MVDASRDYLSGRFVSLVASIDNFFGNDRNYQETNDSVLQMDINKVIGYNGDGFVLSGRAKVRLPNTEKRLHLLVETDPDKNTANPSTLNQSAQPAPASPVSYGAGIRYEKSEDDRWYFSADTGLKLAGIQTAPFARSRLSYATPLEQWRLKASETAFWFNSTGIGETTQLDFERPISDPLLFRATSLATWLHDQQNFNLGQYFSIFQTVDDRTKMQYQAGAIGLTRPITEVTDYFISVLYRHRLHREWLYFDLGPQLHFPRTRNFRASALLGMRLEILFDKSR